MRSFRRSTEVVSHEDRSAALVAEMKAKTEVKQAHEQLVLEIVGDTTDRLALRTLATLDLQPPNERLAFLQGVLRHLVVQVFEADRPDHIGYEFLPSRADKLKYGSTKYFGTGQPLRYGANGYEIVEAVLYAAQPVFEQLEILED